MMMIARMTLFLSVLCLLPILSAAQVEIGKHTLSHNWEAAPNTSHPHDTLRAQWPALQGTLTFPIGRKSFQRNFGIHSNTGDLRQSPLPGPSDLITPVMLRFSNSTAPKPVEWVRNKPGAAWASSLILPGSAQAVHGNWLRAALYFSVEAAALYTHFEYRGRGRHGERGYLKYADENWSVVQYANWIIEYHDENNISNPHLDPLRDMVEGVSPTFDPNTDWDRVDRELLNRVERETPYITPDNLYASFFSHSLEAYGSQQYYELISKYYQYSAGWNDYYTFHNSQNTNPYEIDRNGQSASPQFHTGAERSEQFNADYRLSNNMLSLLILNHFVSAMDAFFTVRLKVHNMEISTGENSLHYFRVLYRF